MDLVPKTQMTSSWYYKKETCFDKEAVNSVALQLLTDVYCFSRWSG